MLAENSIEAETHSAILAEIDGLGAIYRQQGLEALLEEVERRANQPYRGGIYVVTGADGEALAGNVAGWTERLPETLDWISFSVTSAGERAIPVRARAFVLPAGEQLVIGRALVAQDAFRRALNRSLLVGFLGALALGLLGGFLLARQTERRVQVMSRAIDEVRAGSLEARLPARSTGGDEFDRLSLRINKLLAESESLIRGMRQVTDDVAHDLRTPLQRLHARLEDALAGAEGTTRVAIEEALDDLDRLLRLFRTVLLITNTESGVPKQSFQDVDLSAIADDAGELYEAVFDERGIVFDRDVAPGQHVEGNAALIAQAVANLLDNAGKFTRAGGRVALRLRRDPLCIEVRDTGPGIPPERRAEVLRRFTRLETARDTPGHGLGLALVAAVAKLHGGRLELDDAGPGLVARFFIAKEPTEA